MPMKKLSIVMILLLLPLLLAIAMTKAGGDRRNSNSVPPTSSGPPSEMSVLYPRIGRWEATIRSQPNAELPKGGIDKGLMIVEKGPGGFSVVQNFHSTGASGDLRGQSFTWWDKETKTYKSVWCDNQQGCTAFTTVIHGNS